MEKMILAPVPEDEISRYVPVIEIIGYESCIDVCEQEAITITEI